MTDPKSMTAAELRQTHLDVVGEDAPAKATKAEMAEAIDAVKPRNKSRRLTFTHHDGRVRTVIAGTRAAKRYQRFPEVWTES